MSNLSTKIRKYFEFIETVDQYKIGTPSISDFLKTRNMKKLHNELKSMILENIKVVDDKLMMLETKELEDKLDKFDGKVLSFLIRRGEEITENIEKATRKIMLQDYKKPLEVLKIPEKLPFEEKVLSRNTVNFYYLKDKIEEVINNHVLKNLKSYFDENETRKHIDFKLFKFGYFETTDRIDLEEIDVIFNESFGKDITLPKHIFIKEMNILDTQNYIYKPVYESPKIKRVYARPFLVVKRNRYSKKHENILGVFGNVICKLSFECKLKDLQIITDVGFDYISYYVVSNELNTRNFLC